MNWEMLITAVPATIAAGVSIWNIREQNKNHKKQLEAQIISNSRVQWIKEVREIYSNFINLSADFHNELLFVIYHDMDNDRAEKDFNAIRGQFWASYYQLISYFPREDSDSRNEDLINIFSEMVSFLEEKLEYSYEDPAYKNFVPSNTILQKVDISEQYKTMLDILSDNFSAYLKCEWERAKKEVL